MIKFIWFFYVTFDELEVILYIFLLGYQVILGYCLEDKNKKFYKNTIFKFNELWVKFMSVI